MKNRRSSAVVHGPLVCNRDSGQRRLASSALQASVLLLVVLPAYIWLFPWLESLVVLGARGLLDAVPGGVRLEWLAAGGWLVSSTSAAPGRSLAFGSELFGMVSLSSLAITTCLFLATPLPWRKRLMISLLGVTSVMVLTAVSLAASSWILILWCLEGTDNPLCRNVAGFLSPWSHVLSFSVWLGIAGRTWIGHENTRSRRRHVRRGAVSVPVKPSRPRRRVA